MKVKMTKLQRLTQDDKGRLLRPDRSAVFQREFSLAGKIQTLTLQNGESVDSVINEMAERKSAWIPPEANAYIASDFNGSTQHLRIGGNFFEHFFSVYAVQFITDYYQER